MSPMKARLGSILLLAVLAGSSAAQTDLEQGFKTPPDQAKPHTWWHWMNGNITKEGITADLEAMKKIGLGGAQLFNVSESIPEGPIKMMTPEWRELVKFAISEADRLGIEICMHNCGGWSSSGGPWVKPEHAMQMVTTSRTLAKGPQKYSAALPKPPTRIDYYRDIAVLAFPTPAEGSENRIKDISPKAGFEYRYNQQPAGDPFAPAAIVKRDSIIDLTGKLSPDGTLTWDMPEGSWTILRMGHTPTGARNAPSPESGRGLECDKLSREAFDAFWAGMMGPVIEDAGPLAGKTLNNALIDSYEMGGQNWTPIFREEFKKRRGYDPLLLLPAITGHVVDSGEISERFLWDFRRTIADLFADNYYTRFAEICREKGMLASVEPYDGPFECMLTGRNADIPMGEFWIGGGETISCKLAASVGHAYGRKIIGAEAFTAFPTVGRWQNDPASLKGIGDLMYTVGINRYIIHRYAHQPWNDKVPGMTMGQWGTHFERTATWWDQGSAWISYLTRCQYLLQQGLFAADVCYFTGDAAPNDAPLDLALKSQGYDYDACNPDVLFNRMTIKDGRLVLPDGMSYRVLALPSVKFMTPRTLTRIRDLVQQGATVIGPAPSQSPSLADYPACDAQVAKLSDELWGPGAASVDHPLGKGRIISGKSPEEVLKASGIEPDCRFSGATGKVTWIHRIVGDTDIYFVSNQSLRSQEVECSFRISGKLPELWHADTGITETAPIWSDQSGRTSVPIRFEPSGSVFVVFRKPVQQSNHVVAIKAPAGAAPPPVPKIQITKAAYEAIDGAGSADVTAKVAAMAQSGQMGIPAHNSSFGDPAYNHLKRLRVDYTIDGKPHTRTADENAVLDLIAPAPDVPAMYSLRNTGTGLELCAFQTGAYELTSSRGAKQSINITGAATESNLEGPWTVTFPPDRGAPASITLPELTSWTNHADPGVRYFSGTAEYQTSFEIPAGSLGSGKAIFLDLGGVKNIAEVTLNGKDLGTWWKPPFSADITPHARAGTNTLRIRITNLWVNRLIGDEQFPDDCEWNGKPLKKWPQWMLDGSPRPTKERITFTTWKHFTKDSTPLDSGLLGPVKIRSAICVPIQIGENSK